MLSSRFNAAFIVLTLMVAMLLSAGCGSKTNAPVDPEAVKKELLGKVWRCEYIFEREIPDESRITLEFLEDGTVQGMGGCNSYAGPYTITGDSIKIGPLRSTKKACAPVTDEQEYTYLTFLPLVNRVEVDDDELELFSNEADAPIQFYSEDD